MRSLSEGPLIPKPAGAGPWGSDLSDDKYILEEDLHPVAQRLRSWLRTDFERTFAKHNAGRASDTMLRVCSFLDPRHKDLSFLPETEREDLVKQANIMLLKLMEKDPKFRQSQSQAAAASKHADAVQRAEDTKPDALALAALVRFDEKSLKCKKLEDLRQECRLRKLDTSGMKAALVQRLAQWCPELTHSAAVAAASAAQPPPPAHEPFGEQQLLLQVCPDLSPEAQVMSLQLRCKRQIADYRAMARIDLCESPLLWWKRNSADFLFCRDWPRIA